MIKKILDRNKRKFNAYNEFRKALFAELAPNDSEAILYLLPWLLSVNDPKCPGYIPDLQYHFRVYDIDYAKAIRNREPDFKKKFGIRRHGTLLKTASQYHLIHGLYTIGSVGSVAHTALSDCDIWVCIDKTTFDKPAWSRFNQKINLIKDWLDQNLKMPVYFFLCDVDAIRECRFGSVNTESCGSAQQKVLKEEFYRTCMVICGKTPLWWLCHNDAGNPVSYNDALEAIRGDDYWEYDLIDFGDIDKIEKAEYFGAALWQLHKSLSQPLKSIIKIYLLKSLLESPDEKLLCHRFREAVYAANGEADFPDFSLFTMASILDHFGSSAIETGDFLLECYYLQCAFNPYNRTQRIKKHLAKGFFSRFPMARDKQLLLRQSSRWELNQQVALGNRIFRQLLKVFGDINEVAQGVASESDMRDLTILGRRISAYYSKKTKKVPILQKPTGVLNVLNLTLQLSGESWKITADENPDPVVKSKNVIFAIAFIVWNRLFSPSIFRMRPNPTNITLKEVVNLAETIQSFFGGNSVLDVKFSNYLKMEHINKLLVVTGFENSPWHSGQKEIFVVFTNSHGELFSEKFTSQHKFCAFLEDVQEKSETVEINFYIQRNSTSFEKLIQRLKQKHPQSPFN